MKRIFGTKSTIVKIALVLAVIILFEFSVSKPVEAAEIGGTLLKPIVNLVVYLADGVISILQNALLGIEKSFITIDLNHTGTWLTMVIIIASLAVVAVAAVALIVVAAPEVALSLGVSATIVSAGTALSTAGAATVAGIATSTLLSAGGVFVLSTVFAKQLSTILEAMFGETFVYCNIGISPETILNGSISFFSVDFFNDSGTVSSDGTTPIVDVLRNVVSSVYISIRDIALLAMLIVIMYVAIRGLLALNPREKSRWKESFGNCLMGLVIIVLLHFGMSLSVSILNTIIASFDTSAYGLEIVDEDTDADARAEEVAGSAEEQQKYLRGVEYVIKSKTILEALENINDEDVETEDGTTWWKFWEDKDEESIVRITTSNFLEQARYNAQIVYEDPSATEDTESTENEGENLADVIKTWLETSPNPNPQQYTVKNAAGDEMKITATYKYKNYSVSGYSYSGWYLSEVADDDTVLYKCSDGVLGLNEEINDLEDYTVVSETISGTEADDSDLVSTWTFIGWSFVYVIEVIITIAFVWLYGKRVLFIALLTMAAPIVGVMYPINKVRGGTSQALNTWFRNYFGLLIMQPFHLLLYTVLIGSAMTLAWNNVIYVILALLSLVFAERMFRNILGLQEAEGMGLGNAINGTTKAINTATRTAQSLARRATRVIGSGIRGASNLAAEGIEASAEIQQNKIRYNQNQGPQNPQLGQGATVQGLPRGNANANGSAVRRTGTDGMNAGIEAAPVGNNGLLGDGGTMGINAGREPLGLPPHEGAATPGEEKNPGDSGDGIISAVGVHPALLEANAARVNAGGVPTEEGTAEANLEGGNPVRVSPGIPGGENLEGFNNGSDASVLPDSSSGELPNGEGVPEFGTSNEDVPLGLNNTETVSSAVGDDGGEYLASGTEEGGFLDPTTQEYLNRYNENYTSSSGEEEYNLADDGYQSTPVGLESSNIGNSTGGSLATSQSSSGYSSQVIDLEPGGYGNDSTMGTPNTGKEEIPTVDAEIVSEEGRKPSFEEIRNSAIDVDFTPVNDQSSNTRAENSGTGATETSNRRVLSEDQAHRIANQVRQGGERVAKSVEKGPDGIVATAVLGTIDAAGKIASGDLGGAATEVVGTGGRVMDKAEAKVNEFIGGPSSTSQQSKSNNTQKQEQQRKQQAKTPTKLDSYGLNEEDKKRANSVYNPRSDDDRTLSAIVDIVKRAPGLASRGEFGEAMKYLRLAKNNRVPATSEELKRALPRKFSDNGSEFEVLLQAYQKMV